MILDACFLVHPALLQDAAASNAGCHYALACLNVRNCQEKQNAVDSIRLASRVPVGATVAEAALHPSLQVQGLERPSSIVATPSSSARCLAPWPSSTDDSALHSGMACMGPLKLPACSARLTLIQHMASLQARMACLDRCVPLNEAC